MTRWTVLAALSLAYGLLSLTVTNSYYQLILTLVPVWATFALGWNVFSGYAGLLSFGHAAFFGAGAYVVTVGAAWYGVSPWFGIPLGGALGAVTALCLGAVTFRLRGHYFALAMLAYPLAVLYVLEWARMGEISFPLNREAPVWFMHFESPRTYTLLALALFITTFVCCALVERSAFGLALRATGLNEAAAEAAGVDTLRLRLRAITLSGAISGVSGGFYAVVLLIVTPPTLFGMLTSAQPMILTLFGGLGSVWGPVIGAAILVPLSEGLRAELGSIVPGIQGIVLGFAIIGVVLLAPQGIFWSVRDRWRKRPASVGAVSASPAAYTMRHHADPKEMLLQVKGLSRSFGGLRAVSDVSFSVRQGEIMGIVGPNGAGKTTLFNMLSGFVRPTAGSISIAGLPVDGAKPHVVCRMGVGRTFQVVRTFPGMSLLENVLVGAFHAFPDRAEAEAASRRAVTRAGLDSRLGAPVSELTNQELRLMELARAIASEPAVVLMDEPLAGLGRSESEVFLRVVQGLAQQGLTVVIIEHTMHVMVRLVDRLLVLDHGQVIADGAPTAVLNQPAVIEAYLGTKWSRRADAKVA